MEEKISCPKVFISYSWVVGDRVLDLAQRLMANGVEVVLDKWDLKPGHDKYAFMEQSVSDASVHKVLIICDKSYAEKANLRFGGVGDETTIISPDVYQRVEQEKFIPIVFEKDEDGKEYLPNFIKSRIYIDLSGNSFDAEKNFEALLRNIFNKPLYSKPAIGKRPEWLVNEKIDYSAFRDVIKQLRHENNKTKIDYLIRRALDQVIELVKNTHLNQELPPDEAMLEAVNETKILRDLVLEYFEVVMFAEADFAKIIPEFFEDLLNEVNLYYYYKNNQTIDYLHEVAEFLIWELFICTTALCLYYEKYSILREILMHSYYVNSRSTLRNEMKSYGVFCIYAERLDSECKAKCDEPRLITLQGRMLTQREKRPIYTRKTLCAADMILSQLHPLMSDIESWKRWLAISGVYAADTQDIWVKMKSRQHCRKIFDLLNVANIEELIIEVNKNMEATQNSPFFGSSVRIQSILDSISIQDIGTIN